MKNKDKLLRTIRRVLNKQTINIYYPDKEEIDLINLRTIYPSNSEFALTIPKDDPMFDDYERFKEVNSKMDSIMKSLGYNKTTSFNDVDLYYRYYGTLL